MKLHEIKLMGEFDKIFRENSGENIYFYFTVWCYGFKTPQDVNNPYAFAEYLKNEKITLTPIQRQYLAKKYFNIGARQ